MRTHQDLTIRGPQDRLCKLPDIIENRLSDGWMRDREQEAYLRRNGVPEVYCFRVDAKRSRQAATLSLFRNTPDELKVTNIVPSYSASLSLGEYNQILEEFTNRFARPAAEALSLEVLVSKPDVTLRDLMPPEVALALREFSSNANRVGSGTSHPLDNQRWEKFVIAAHHAEVDIDPSMLSRWLVEEELWPSESAAQLSMDYEQARSILEEYDRQLQSA